ncbi:MAG: site-2 protease family protein [Conexivisphaerales archaeon]
MIYPDGGVPQYPQIGIDESGNQQISPHQKSTDNSPDKLPEAHNRIGDLSRRSVAKSSPTTLSWGEGGYYVGRTSQPRAFSRTEVRDILLAWISLSVAFTVAVTGGLFGGFASRLGVTENGVPLYLSLEWTFVLALMTIGVGFVLHELMHKFIAERYGFMAEFRMWIQGLAFALLSALVFGIVWAAPGATYINGFGISEKENGIISLAGPLTNVFIALLFLPLLFVNTNSVVIFEAGYLGSYFNFFLATFNMLPIFVLDGAKVWRWNKLYWAVVFVPLAIVVASYIFGYFP